MTRNPRARRRLTAASVALAVAATVAACTNTPTPDPTSSPTPTPTPSLAPTPSPSESVDPAVAAAAVAVLEAYRGFWDAKVAYLAEPNQPEPEVLRVHAVDKALSGVREVARLYQANGIISEGEPVLTPTVADVELEGEPSALITDCVDVTDWQPVFSATGESAAAPGQNNRQITESQAIFYDGRWVIRDSTIYRDRSC